MCSDKLYVTSTFLFVCLYVGKGHTVLLAAVAADNAATYSSVYSTNSFQNWHSLNVSVLVIK